MKLKSWKKLIKAWGGLCIVCGRPFENIHCVTREHIIPRQKMWSFMFYLYDNEDKIKRAMQSFNIAPAHTRCNTIKADGSLLVAARKIELEAKNRKNFERWLNKFPSFLKKR